jgi:hypothetical protein
VLSYLLKHPENSVYLLILATRRTFDFNQLQPVSRSVLVQTSVHLVFTLSSFFLPPRGGLLAAPFRVEGFFLPADVPHLDNQG